MEKDKKYVLNFKLTAVLEDGTEVVPEVGIKDSIDKNQTLELSATKEKVSAEYKLKF